MRITLRICIVLVLCTPILGQTIDSVALSPNKAEYYVGDSIQISWKYSKIPIKEKVDVRLINVGTNQTLGILEDNLPVSTGKMSGPWAVPEIYTSLQSRSRTYMTQGSYKIRVQWKGTRNFNDSHAFTVKKKITTVNKDAGSFGAPDFHVVDLALGDGMQLIAKVANLGNQGYSGHLGFRIYENETFMRDLNPIVDLPRGVTKEIALDFRVQNMPCGSWVQVTADYENIVFENSDNGDRNAPNNSMMKQLFLDCYDINFVGRIEIGKGPVKIVNISNPNAYPMVDITPDLCESVTRHEVDGVTTSGFYLKVRLPFNVFMRNCGYCEDIRDVWVKIMSGQNFVGSDNQLAYYRSRERHESGKVFTVRLVPEFKFTPPATDETVFLLRIEGGFRQSVEGSNMSMRQSNPPLNVRVRFLNFRSLMRRE